MARIGHGTNGNYINTISPCGCTTSSVGCTQTHFCHFQLMDIAKEAFHTLLEECVQVVELPETWTHKHEHPEFTGRPNGEKLQHPEFTGLPNGEKLQHPQFTGLPNDEKLQHPEFTGLPNGEKLQHPQFTGLPNEKKRLDDYGGAKCEHGLPKAIPRCRYGSQQVLIILPSAPSSTSCRQFF